MRLKEDFPLATYLVVQKHSQDSSHHAQNIGGGDRVAKHDQGDTDDHDPFCGICNRITQRADKVQDAEGNDILGKVAETADGQEKDGPWPMSH